MKKNIEKLYNSALKFLTPLSLAEAYKVIVEEAKTLVGAKYSSIFVMDKGHAKRAYTTDSALYKVSPRKNGLVYRSFREKSLIVMENKKLAKTHPAFKHLGGGCDAIIALSYGELTLAVLSVISENCFTDDDLEQLQLFGPMATLAIRKTLLFTRLEESLKSRDLFISTAAHEIKTPLTSIFAYTEMIKREAGLGQTLNREYIDRLYREEIRLAKLTNELLAIGQIKTGRFKLTNVLKQAMLDIKNNYPRHKFKFNNKLKDKAAILYGDEGKLIQLFLNLFANAAKYTSPEKPVKINLSSYPRSYKVDVLDSGAGISREDLPNIFRKFYKGENARKEGVGLGLYLVKYIVDTHKGKINITSGINKGTKVTVILPKK